MSFLLVLKSDGAATRKTRIFFQIEKSQFGLVSRPKTSMISVTVVKRPSVAWPAAKVELWPIERLTANPRNARIHGPEQIVQIRASLREFGWTMPVLVRENGMLIAGHGRLEAAQLEGITEVPTIVARGWTEAQCQAYAIADNKLTELGEWSEELLRLELGDLREAGFDLALTGFDQDELDRLLVVETDGDGDPEDAPEPPADPISKPGDLWICGEHRVYRAAMRRSSLTLRRCWAANSPTCASPTVRTT